MKWIMSLYYSTTGNVITIWNYRVNQRLNWNSPNFKSFLRFFAILLPFPFDWLWTVSNVAEMSQVFVCFLLSWRKLLWLTELGSSFKDGLETRRTLKATWISISNENWRLVATWFEDSFKDRLKDTVAGLIHLPIEDRFWLFKDDFHRLKTTLTVQRPFQRRFLPISGRVETLLMISRHFEGFQDRLEDNAYITKIVDGTWRQLWTIQRPFEALKRESRWFEFDFVRWFQDERCAQEKMWTRWDEWDETGNVFFFIRQFLWEEDKTLISISAVNATSTTSLT